VIEKYIFPWILGLDEEEWIMRKLKEEIVKAVNNPGENVAFEPNAD
jgi:hypothetical protein